MANGNVGRRPYHWGWIAVIWAGFGLIDAMETVLTMQAEGMHHAWTRLFLTTLFSWMPWALATPLIMRLGDRFPPVRSRSLPTWSIHIAACAALGLTVTAWTTLLNNTFNPYAYSSAPNGFLKPWLYKFYSGILTWIILYAAVVVVSYVLESRARLAAQATETARLNELLSKAQLETLRQQIEPHFLFNTLNAVAGLVREQRNDDAVSMIAELSEYLRRVLHESARHQVTLGEELEFTQKFLNIQKLRFADRLQVSVNVPSELHSAQVPSLILQPIVENAIKHGISQRVQGGEVRIGAARCNGMLTVNVYNDGPSIVETAATGVGLSNVRTRLESLYGESFELCIGNQTPSGVEVVVSVPFKE
jgi:signal transduction histidine kinase